MADIFGKLGRMADIWQYGPEGVRENDRKQQEFQMRQQEFQRRGALDNLDIQQKEQVMKNQEMTRWLSIVGNKSISRPVREYALRRALETPEFKGLSQMTGVPLLAEETDVKQLIDRFDNASATLGPEGELQSLKVDKSEPTPTKEIGKYMSSLPPGSPEWKEAAKMTGTNVTTTVDMGTTSPLEKATKGAIERDIEAIDDIALTLEEVDKLTKDEYLTYGGRAKAGITKIGEKITGGELGSSDFLAGYSQWKMLSQDLYLKKRKQITGVAARPEEANEIAQAIPDPTKDSPTQFRAKQKKLREILQLHRERLQMLRSWGIENPTKEQLSKIPLSEVKPAPKSSGQPANNLEQMSDEELEAEIRRLEGGR